MYRPYTIGEIILVVILPEDVLNGSRNSETGLNCLIQRTGEGLIFVQKTACPEFPYDNNQLSS